ncbi:hypothetical protein C0J52_10560 [Blattella germanica]|nr:hypothetical protein C0J52_10560 [Blattella germanica]
MQQKNELWRKSCILSLHVYICIYCTSVFVVSWRMGARTLFVPGAMGLDTYTRTRDRTKTQFASLIDKFKVKMTEFSEPNSKNMIFTEDLKNMIHLVEATPEDLDLSKELRFGSYVFGPVVMRMYHLLDKPDEALTAFKDSDLEAFFAQLSTYQILMDLLFEHRRYQDVLDVFEIVRARQHQDTKFPRNVVILTYAACYKLNTPESLKYGMDLWKELKEVGHIPMRRAVTFAAGLALNQNAPHVALEMISDVLQQNYVSVAALSDLGRPEDALPVLRSIIDSDVPRQSMQTISSEVIEKLKQATEKTGNKELSYEVQQLEKRLQDGGHISNVKIDEQLCTPIAQVVLNSNQDRNRKFVAASFNRDDRGGRARAYARPGLKDLY